jgi:cell division GTPase FtsZ
VKLTLVGVGQAGGKVVDALLAYEQRAGLDFVVDAVAVNTARTDLLGLQRVSPDRQVLVGTTGVKGHGVGADNDLGARLVAEDIEEVLSAIDDVPTHAMDAFLVVAGLGGGTGSGGAPVIARELRHLYTEPVYGLGILPGSDEGGIYTLNAARSFQTFVREVDNLIAFDNDAWRRSGQTLESGYGEMNEQLARVLGVLFSAGETDGTFVAESVVDASEIINTLSNGGVTTIGYAAAPVERAPKGLLATFGASPPEPDRGERLNRVLTLVRRAALGRLTLPCEVDAVERALVVVAGPPPELSRRGVERARRWVEEATGSMEVRGGDYPMDSGYVAAVVVLSGVYDVPRIKELQRLAIEAQRERSERDAASEAALSDLISTPDDALEPLF